MLVLDFDSSEKETKIQEKPEIDLIEQTEIDKVTVIRTNDTNESE